uniref:Cid1 n=1 Tax=Drosophila kanapiae TaxID=137072 RepID=A0A1V0HRJ7_9MUSC|nr:Cid1 [Drosophila kanapiae]
MRPLMVKDTNGGASTDSSNSDSLLQLDDYDLETAASRLTLQDANNRRISTRRRAGEDQENCAPVAVKRQQTLQRSQGGSSAPARRRKQRGPVSRARQMEREIRRLQASTLPMVPRLPFSRLVKELIQKLTLQPLRITEGALQVLQESTELYLTQRFEDAYLLTLHRGRVTLEVRDMALVSYLIDVSNRRS